MQVNIKLYELYCCCRCMVMVNAYRGHYGSSLSLTDILWSRWNDCTYRRNYFSCLVISNNYLKCEANIKCHA